MDSVLSILSSVLSICCSRSSSEDGFNSLEAQAHQSSSSSTSYSSSSTTDGWSYDVFLSFRGEDTRKNFTDHLYTALERAGVKTFRDDKLKRGEPIAPSLLEAIEKSRSSIAVFSRNYASSKWCLEELAKMVECRDRNGQTLFPIFFDVDPSDVRNQTGSFAKAFCQHEKRFEKEKVEKWRGALREVGQLSGWSLKDVANGHESKLITLVIKEVLRELNKTTFDVAKHPVGIDSRVDEMMSFLQVESSNVLFVGIWGLGGIGKTTIAKAVLNKICGGFQCFCFLADIRAVASQKGLVTLQKQLLNILKEGSEDINDDSSGKTAIKARLCSKKVLLILDDVDDHKQLDALAGRPDWFGPGSRIIITTRDEHLLNVHEVGLIYKPKELDFDQSLLLFNKHAFCRDQPPEDYRELSKRAVRTAGGLPLALEVFGSFLFNKETTEWENALDKLKKIPLKEIQERLKLSYEGLDDFEKEIFLDIACFFIGMDKELAITILEGCGFYSRIGIKVLIHKSLVKIDDGNKLRMHDQIRDMGREIIRQQNWKEPEMRSRLWLHDEALGVLMKQTGTVRIEGICIDFKLNNIHSKLSIEAFALMSKLRLLQIDYADLEGEFHNLPKELRWLSWNGCPLEYLPTTFHLGELVALELRNSRITQVKNCLHQNKLLLEKLKVLDLTFCRFLTRTSDLSGLPCLERLILSRCAQLVEVDESIVHLKRLVFLDLQYCNKLTELPSSICKLKCLKILLLSSCINLYELPENLGAMESLTEFSVDNTSINQLPDSIGILKNLTRLSLMYCYSVRKIPNFIWRIESLIELNLVRTELKEIPDFCLPQTKIQVLNVRCCRLLSRLPVSIGSFRNLKSLYIDDTNIAELPNSIGSLEKLEVLTAIRCKKLVKLPNSMGKMRSLNFFDIHDAGIFKLPEDFGMLSSLKMLIMDGCRGFIGFFPVSFSCLCSLEELSASNCNVSEGGLPSDFGRLSSLKILELRGNKFYSLPSSINALSRLQTLDLRKCKMLHSLPELPSSLTHLQSISMERLPNPSNLKRLKKLLLSDCEMLAKIQGLEGYETLEVLDMMGCTSIERLPSLSNLKGLKTLRLNNCGKLAEIQGLEGCEALELLDMKGCTSTERLSSLSKLRRLKELLLIDCEKLAKIQGLEGCEALKVLYMVGCTSIERLPSFSNLKGLKILWLNNCGNLAEIQGLEGCQALELLDMSCSSVEILPDISNLKRLKKLLLSDCEKLTKIQGLEGCEALELLDMKSCSSIEILPDISNLKRLKKLLLSDCEKLTKIQGLESCEAVEVLGMMGCTSIERLPGLSNLKGLKKLQLDNCGKLAEIEGLEGCEALELLDMRNCTSTERLSDLSKLKRLKKINLQNCDNLSEIQGLEGLVALEELWFMGFTSMERLPDISNLKRLMILWVDHFEKLSEIHGLEGLEALESLFMYNCTSIERLPDLSKFKRLKKLYLEGCEKLAEIQGLEDLKFLFTLYIKRCTSIERLPNLSKFKRLEKLHLEGCEKLAKIQGLEGLEALEDFVMYKCSSIERLPDLSKLKRLKKLKLMNCEKLTKAQGLDGLEALENLVVYRCSSIGRLPDLSKLKRLTKLELLNCDNLTEIQGLDGLEALKVLQMWGCHSIERLSDLSNLKRLAKLELINCEKLAEIQGLEDLEALEELYLRRCTSIERLPDLSNLKELTILDLTDCRNLAKIQRNEKRKALKELYIGGCSSALANSLKNSLVPGVIECLSTLIFPGSKIPDWFTPAKLSHEEHGSRLYCEVPPGRALLNPEQRWQQHKIKIIGVMLCFVFVNQDGEDSAIWVGVDVKRNGKHVFSCESLSHLWVPQTHQEDQLYFYHFQEEEEDPQGKKLFSMLEEGGEVSFKMKLRVKKAGICVAYK